MYRVSPDGKTLVSDQPQRGRRTAVIRSGIGSRCRSVSAWPCRADLKVGPYFGEPLSHVRAGALQHSNQAVRNASPASRCDRIPGTGGTRGNRRACRAAADPPPRPPPPGRSVACCSACSVVNGAMLAGEIASARGFPRTAIRSVSHPVAVAHDGSACEEADVTRVSATRPRPPPRSATSRVVGEQQPSTLGETQQRGELPQVDVQHEPHGLTADRCPCAGGRRHRWNETPDRPPPPHVPATGA